MSQNDYLYARKNALEQFMSGFDKEYKTIKKITHKCQYKCYDNEEYTRHDAEECARRCLHPFMMQKKVNNDLIAKCEYSFKKEEQECLSMSPNRQKDCFKEMSERYNACLEKELPKVKKCVNEHIKAFDDIVYGKADKK